MRIARINGVKLNTKKTSPGIANSRIENPWLGSGFAATIVKANNT